jgi:hypothetical protein
MAQGMEKEAIVFWSSFSLAHRMRKNRCWGFRIVLPWAIGIVPVPVESVLGQHLAGHDAAPGHEHALDLGDQLVRALDLSLNVSLAVKPRFHPGPAKV